MGSAYMKGIVFSIRLLVGVIIGILISILYLERDENIKCYFTQQIKQEFEKALQCRLSGTLETCDILTSSLSMHNILVNDTTEAWYWQAKKAYISWSWLTFFLHKKIDLTVRLDQLQVHSKSDADNAAYISDHINNLISGKSDNPLIISALLIKKGEFFLHNPIHEIDFKTNFDIHLGIFPTEVQLHAYLSQGSLTLKNNLFIQDLGLTINTSASENFYHTGTRGTFDLCIGEQKSICHVNGSWKEDIGLLKIHDTRGLLELSADFSKNEDDFVIKGTISSPLDLFKHVRIIDAFKDLSGHCLITGQIKANKNNFKWDAQCHIEDMNYKQTSLGSLVVNGENSQKKINGDTNWFMNNKPEPVFKAIWNFDTQSSIFEIKAINSSVIEQSNGTGWKIEPDHCAVQGIYDWRNGLKANLLLHPKHNTLGISPKIFMNTLYHENSFFLEGSLNDYKYSGLCTINDRLILDQLSIKQDDKLLLQLLGSQNDLFNGFIDYQLIQDLISSIFKQELPGQGIVKINGAINDRQLKAFLRTEELVVRLGRMYNFMRSAQSEICLDVSNSTVSFLNTEVKLDKGSLKSNRALVHLNENGIYYAHIPCIVHKLLLNYDKDFFVIGSGALLLIKDHAQSAINGTVIVDRSLIKKNILSANARPIISSTNIQNSDNLRMNIALLSKNPVHIKTAFLETDAALDLLVGNIIDDPRISGTVTLRSGHLAFPYKPLNIMHGKIYFLPHQQDDPLIELVAKNQIRRYQVTMHVDGSVQQPLISFESTPALTEEQIVTLLLAGNADGALSLAMPSLVMNNIKNVLFGQEQSESTLQSYFNQLLLPLPNIRLVPGFSDQHGRGGLRGSIEIDINDQLHAMIQKNFSLPEDTRIEVEYNISDDMTVRGMKDERGDLGAEMEMRFKF